MRRLWCAPGGRAVYPKREVYFVPKCMVLACAVCAAVPAAASRSAAASRRALIESLADARKSTADARAPGPSAEPAAAVGSTQADAAGVHSPGGSVEREELFSYESMGKALANLIFLQEKTADAADDGVFALMNHTAYALAALTGPPPPPPQNTSLIKFRPPMVVLNSTDLLTQTQAVAINLTERLINATEHALDPSEGGLYGQLAGMLRGDGKDAAPRPSQAPGAASGSPGAAALQSGAGAVFPNAKTDEHDHSDKSLLKDMQKLVGNDTINALEAAVFPFILVAPLGINYAKAAVLIYPRTGLVAPVLFNIQESLMHIEAIGFDVSPRLINIEPAVIRMQGALASIGGREGVVNIVPSLISLAGAVVNVVPDKACKTVHVDPNLIKVQGAGKLVIDRGPKFNKTKLDGPLGMTTDKGNIVSASLGPGLRIGGAGGAGAGAGPGGGMGAFGNMSAGGAFGNMSGPGAFGNMSGPGAFGNMSGPGGLGGMMGPGAFGNMAPPVGLGGMMGPGAFGNMAGPGALGNMSGPGTLRNSSGAGALSNMSSPGAFGNTSSPGSLGNTSSPGAFGNTSSPGALGNTSSTGLLGNTSSPGLLGNMSATGAGPAGSASSAGAGAFGNFGGATPGGAARAQGSGPGLGPGAPGSAAAAAGLPGTGAGIAVPAGGAGGMQAGSGVGALGLGGAGGSGLGGGAAGGGTGLGGLPDGIASIMDMANELGRDSG